MQLDLWDTAGAERYRTITLEYFRKTSIVFLVYRTDKPQSLAELRTWMTEAQEYLLPGAIFVLLGNLYVDNTVEVTTETAEDFARGKNIKTHVRLSFNSTAESIITGVLERAVEEHMRVSRQTKGQSGSTQDDRSRWYRKC